MTVRKEGNHVTAPCDSRNFRNASLAAAGEVLDPIPSHVRPDVTKISPWRYGMVATRDHSHIQKHSVCSYMGIYNIYQ